MRLVESHMGGLYLSDREVGDIEEMCCQCGDCDNVLAEVSTKEELLEEIIKRQYEYESDETIRRDDSEFNSKQVALDYQSLIGDLNNE